MSRVALRFVDSIDPALTRRAAALFAERELQADAESETGTCICFVRKLDDGARKAVCALLGRGTERVLVVTQTRTARDDTALFELLAAGAADVLTWNDKRPDLSADCVLARVRHWQEVDEVVETPVVRGRLLGCSRVWTAALRELVEAAQLSTAPLLITGESGTGKELAASMLHDLDPRPDKKQLVMVDCTTVVASLSGSEFFGHERGAFTGAEGAREGAFAQADGGTLVLDELGELPLSLQGELLRVIQEGTYKRVGSGVWRHTQFRLICATNRDLRQEVAQGRFRSDLYHRVAGWTVRLPSLRERTGDVPDLARHFVAQLRPDLGDDAIDPAVLDVLCRRQYPGNVRELRQIVARIVARHVGPGPITAGALPPDERPAAATQADVPVEPQAGALEAFVRGALAGGASLHEIGRAAEDAALQIALAESDGNLRRASTKLGVTDRALQMRRASARKNGANGSSS
jgi:transcriptional regulator with GAF, ATPase, and Fis domain